MCSRLGVGGESTTSTPLQGPWKGPETLGSGGPLLAPWASRKAFLPGEWSVESLSSEALDEAAREEARATVPLQGPLVPAVLTLLVHKDNVSLLQLYLCLALGRVRDHDTVPEGGTDTTVGEPDPEGWRMTQGWPAVCWQDLFFPFPLWYIVVIWGYFSPLKIILFHSY